MKLKVGMCFSRPFEGNEPLNHIGKKLPVYLRLLKLCQQKDWQVFVLTRKTYEGGGVFNGAWKFKDDQFSRVEKPIKIDLVYDRTGGIRFPLEGDTSLTVVNQRDFKVLCWDKRLAYEKIGKYMPKTLWVGEKKNLVSVLPKIKGDWVALKPFNGLKGIGIFVGPKKKALEFEFPKKYPRYIAQEYVDTSGGIPGIVEGLHDLRVTIINSKAVWAHIRTPPPGQFQANVAQGGKIKEVDLEVLPELVKQTVEKIASQFFQKYDNPVYCVDFGIEEERPLVFEINDLMGFPAWEMEAREGFLEALVNNFAQKLGVVKEDED